MSKGDKLVAALQTNVHMARLMLDMASGYSVARSVGEVYESLVSLCDIIDEDEIPIVFDEVNLDETAIDRNLSQLAHDLVTNARMSDTATLTNMRSIVVMLHEIAHLNHVPLIEMLEGN